MQSSMIDRLSEYVTTALTKDVPESVVRKGSHHVLDSLAAIVSGSQLPAGRAGAAWSAKNPGREEATVVGAGHRTSARHAALANAMSAHADETDDSHEPSRTHPGCGIVPAALAIAEREGRTGEDLLRAVILGYDVAGRMNPALWPDYMFMRGQSLKTHLHSTHAIGSLWGATAAVAALSGISQIEAKYLFSYSAQQTAGIVSWLRDVEHIEKSYVFAAMGASNAVEGLSFVQAGWPGVRDVFTGYPSFFQAFGLDSDPELLVRGLGKDFVVSVTNLKRFSVGSPCQAPLQALLDMMDEFGLRKDDIARVECTLATAQTDTVGDPDMPDICLPYLLDVALNDGALTFLSAHDLDRFASWKGGSRDSRIVVISDDEMAPTRQAIVRIVMTDGSEHRRHEDSILGSPKNPMPEDVVRAKAFELCAPVIGDKNAEKLCQAALDLTTVSDCRSLTELLSAGKD